MKNSQIVLPLLFVMALTGCQKQPLVVKHEQAPPPTINEARTTAKQFAAIQPNGNIVLTPAIGKSSTARVMWEYAMTLQKNGQSWLRVPIQMNSEKPLFSSMALVFRRNNSQQISAYLTTENLVQVNDTTRRMVAFYLPNGKMHSTYLIRDNEKTIHRVALDSPVAMQSNRLSQQECAITGFRYTIVSCTMESVCTFYIFNNYTMSCSQTMNGSIYDAEDNEDGGGGGSGGESSPAELLSYDEPEETSDPVVNLEKIIDCFNRLPNAGATYSAKIYVDIPNNTAPERLLTANGNPGHTFVRLTKSSGGQTISQTFGFYPESGAKSVLTLSDVSSTIKNNGVEDRGHEYNASFTANNLSADQFNAMLQAAGTLANRNYNLTNFNCTSYAMGVVNAGLPASRQLMSLPALIAHPVNGLPLQFTHSPSGLYVYLNALHGSGTAEAANIEMGVNKKGATSYGECN